MKKALLITGIIVVETLVLLGVYLVIKSRQKPLEIGIVSVACAEPMQEKELPSFLPTLSPNHYPLIPDSVVLTFDDGPYRYYGNSHSVEHTEIILDILRKENLKATFFLLGIQLDTKVVSTGSTYQRYCEWVRRMFAEGHTVSVHDRNHVPYGRQTRTELADSIIYTRMRIREISGQEPSRYVRSPGGSVSSPAEDFLAKNGYSVVYWHINAEPDTHARPQETLKHLLTELKSGKRGIILMHDRTASGYLQELVNYLKSNRIPVLTLEEWEKAYGLPDVPHTTHQGRFE